MRFVPPMRFHLDCAEIQECSYLPHFEKMTSAKKQPHFNIKPNFWRGGYPCLFWIRYLLKLFSSWKIISSSTTALETVHSYFAIWHLLTSSFTSFFSISRQQTVGRVNPESATSVFKLRICGYKATTAYPA